MESERALVEVLVQTIDLDTQNFCAGSAAEQLQDQAQDLRQHLLWQLVRLSEHQSSSPVLQHDYQSSSAVCDWVT